MKAATLAVGTEVTDGQITDRNSAYISEKLVAAGVDVIEHRAVPDERKLIADALRELTDKVDFLFVTGGLGPTSDDFTRELLSEVYSSPLVFDEPSWQRIAKRFEARGAVAKPIQRQQCFFPKSAMILENPAGTANAFSLSVQANGRQVLVAALPGPPAEVAAVWDLHLAKKIESLIPVASREDLYLWRTLGAGESEIAERVEEIIANAGLRVGYRAHLPYVEVKLWVKRSKAEEIKQILHAIDVALAPWIVGRGKEDLADHIVRASFNGHHIAILDRATGGYVQTRLLERLQTFRKLNPDLRASGSLRITTSLLEASAAEDLPPQAEHSIVLTLLPDPVANQWVVKMRGVESQTLAVQPTSLYNFGSERGQKYMAEKTFHVLSSLAPFA